MDCFNIHVDVLQSQLSARDNVYQEYQVLFTMDFFTETATSKHTFLLRSAQSWLS